MFLFYQVISTDLILIIELCALKSLTIFKCGLKDGNIEGLKSLRNLQFLDLSNNSLTDVNALFESPPPLQTLDVSTNGITVSGIKSVTNVTSLTNLYISETKVNDIAILTGLLLILL